VRGLRNVHAHLHNATATEKDLDDIIRISYDYQENIAIAKIMAANRGVDQ